MEDAVFSPVSVADRAASETSLAAAEACSFADSVAFSILEDALSSSISLISVYVSVKVCFLFLYHAGLLELRLLQALVVLRLPR